MEELKASLEEAKQLQHQSVSTMMKERVKLMEAQKEVEMLKKSTVQLGKQRDVLEVCAYVRMCVSYMHACCNVECCVLVYCL